MKLRKCHFGRWRRERKQIESYSRMGMLNDII